VADEELSFPDHPMSDKNPILSLGEINIFLFVSYVISSLSNEKAGLAIGFRLFFTDFMESNGTLTLNSPPWILMVVELTLYRVARYNQATKASVKPHIRNVTQKASPNIKERNTGNVKLPTMSPMSHKSTLDLYTFI